jgi:hypothetical protein
VRHPLPTGEGKKAQVAVKEDKLVEAVRELLAKHGIKH